jgi:PAS domain S-box-containing protein
MSIRKQRHEQADQVRYEAGEIADQLGDMISAHSPDGTFRYASAASRELLGYEPEDLTGTWIYDHVHPDDFTRLTASHRSVLEGSPGTCSYRLRHRKGQWVWVESNARGVLDERRERVSEIFCSTRKTADRAEVKRVLGTEASLSRDRIQEVLAAEDIRPVYQPIMELETGRVIAYEALSRFPGDPSRTPDRWFSDAWQVGLGVPLELLAVRVIARALPEIPEDIGLCINVSPHALAASGFMRSLGADVHRITVELTEHLDIESYDDLRSALAPVKSAGGATAVDDFGAGVASLQHVLKVQPDWIKLDISLTEKIGENPVAHALASSLVNFAEQIGVGVIAEGIETEEEREELLELGVRFGQGFHLGMPAPLEEALGASAS